MDSANKYSPINLLPGKSYAQANFVYTNDDLNIEPVVENTISGFSVAENGALIPISGSPFPTGGVGSGGGFFAANRITSCIVGNFLYASNDVSGDVSGFSIDPSTGVLTPVAGSPFPVAGGGGQAFDISLVCMPDSRFVIAANGNANLITVFRIVANGALTPIADSPFSITAPPDGIKVSPDNKFLAVAEPSINSIEMFGIASDGALTPVPGSPFRGTSGLGLIAGADINCAGDLLFAGKFNSSGITIVDVFDISSEGALTSIPGSPFVEGAGANSNVVLLSADDKFLFVSNQDSSSVTVFTVGVDGTLTAVPGSPFSAPASFAPSGMATDRSGKFLYVADGNMIYVYGISIRGALTLVPGSPFSTRQFGSALSLTAFPGKTCAIDVILDVKPGRAENTVNPKSKGVIPVAILGTNSFDVSTIDQDSVRFGPNQASPKGRAHLRYINHDRFLDLVLYFRTQDSGIECGDSSVSITGQTVDGIPIQGSDSINTVGCKEKSRKKK